MQDVERQPANLVASSSVTSAALCRFFKSGIRSSRRRAIKSAKFIAATSSARSAPPASTTAFQFTRSK
jgi:hypothetical protein